MSELRKVRFRTILVGERFSSSVKGTRKDSEGVERPRDFIRIGPKSRMNFLSPNAQAVGEERYYCFVEDDLVLSEEGGVTDSERAEHCRVLDASAVLMEMDEMEVVQQVQG